MPLGLAAPVLLLMTTRAPSNSPIEHGTALRSRHTPHGSPSQQYHIVPHVHRMCGGTLQGWRPRHLLTAGRIKRGAHLRGAARRHLLSRTMGPACPRLLARAHLCCCYAIVETLKSWCEAVVLLLARALAVEILDPAGLGDGRGSNRGR